MAKYLKDGNRKYGWKVTGYKPRKRCERCKSKKGLRVHHKDRNQNNNRDHSNLETLCMKCHTREHKAEILPAQQTPEYRKRLSEVQIAAWKRPVRRAMRLAKQKKYWSDPKHRLAQAKLTRKIFQNPESYERLCKGTKAAWTEARKKAWVEVMRKRWKSKEYRKRARTNAAFWKDEKWRASISEKFKAAWVLRKLKSKDGKGQKF